MTYSNRGLECPYCGYLDTDAWELVEIRDEIDRTNCPHCGREYEIEIELKQVFRAYPKEED